jgi:Ribonuclease G/E
MKIISKSYDNHMDNDNDNDNNTILDSLDLNKKRSVPKFQKPTIEEVCQHMGGTGDLAERFWNYYESKGWMVGKVKMKNWKAAANNWKKTTFEATKRTNKKLSNYEQGIINQRETIRNAGQDPDQFAPLPQHLKDAGYA